MMPRPGAIAQSLKDAAWLNAGPLAAPARRARPRRRGGARGGRRGAQCAAWACPSPKSTSPPPPCRRRWCGACRRPASSRCPTGIEHGTITVVIDKAPFEVTTLRQDVETYGRHAKVAFGRDWKTRRRAARLHHERALGRARRHGLRLCRRARRSQRAPRALHRRCEPAHRGRLSAHPALLPLSRGLRQRPSGRRGPCRLHRRARRARAALARARAHGNAEAAGGAARDSRRSRPWPNAGSCCACWAACPISRRSRTWPRWRRRSGRRPMQFSAWARSA